MHRLTSFILLLTVGSASLPGDEAPTAGTRRALLVGCSRYPNLPLGMQLRGPANDVLLMRQLLTSKFQFLDQNIVTLSEAAGEKADDLRPTRANIQREFQRLAKAAQKGDLVYIHLSGHGGQQPQMNADDPESYEPDGLSEFFAPVDLEEWDNSKKAVGNAIVDIEWRAWLKAIRAQGAQVVIVVDTCHSGTMVRGTEIVRGVSMEGLKIPAATLAEARKNADRLVQKWPDKLGPKTRGGDDGPPRMTSHVPDLVALYAARPHEPTYEDRYPRGAADAKPQGLLTFTLAQVLTQSPRPLTYVEVVQRVHAKYVAMGRSGPVPSVEGKQRDQEFLGQKSWPGRSRIQLEKKEGTWKVNAGALHGLTAGTILAVYPPGDDKTKLGHVEAIGLGAFDADVRPRAFGDVAKKDDLPSGGTCKVIFVDYGVDRLRVFVEPGKQADALREVVRKIEKAEHSLARLVDRPEQADWLVRATAAGAALVPAAGWVIQRDQKQDIKVFGPVPLDAELSAWLETALARIARARNLLKLTAAMEHDQDLESNEVDAPKIKVEVVRFSPHKAAGAEKVAWGSGGLVLRDGDIIAFEMTNQSRQAMDVSLLFVDSHYGISAVFPHPGTETDNRLKPGETRRSPEGKITGRTKGLEHLVVLAVQARSNRLPIDFSGLQQSSIELAKAKTRGPTLEETPLGKLLQSALYAEGATRGFEVMGTRDHTGRVLSWTTLPRP